MEERRRIVIYVSEADWKYLDLQAGGNLSSWCRDKLVGKKTKAPIGESIKAVVEIPESQEAPKISHKPVPGVCANCEHPKHKHGGFGMSCQADTCLCARFE